MYNRSVNLPATKENTIIRHNKFRFTVWIISWKKTCGKTTTEMGRKHHEGLLVAAECKRTEETSRGQEFLEVGSTRGHGLMRSVAPMNNNNNGLAIELGRRCRNHFLHIIPSEINNTPYIAKLLLGEGEDSLGPPPTTSLSSVYLEF